MVTMVWVVSRLRLKGPSWYLIFIYISPLTSLGQHSRTSRAPQPQKSATLSSQPGGKTTKFIRTGGGIRGGILHLALFLASGLISAQVFLTPLASSSTILHHVYLGLPLPCFPWGFHTRVCLAMLSDGFRSVRPSHPNLHFPICRSILGCFVRFHNSIFDIWSGQKILNIFLRHLLIKTCSWAVIRFEFFQVSQP